LKTYSVQYRPSAQRDIEAIADYVFEQSKNATTTLRYIRRLRDRCRKIGDAPFAHIALDDFGDGVRMAVFERSAVILYRVERNAVFITNVFSAGKDYAALLKRKGKQEEGEKE
jgi:toxin ParE1/3/4